MPESVANTAQRLEQQVPEIIRQWEAKVREAVPAARLQTRSVLRNDVPRFLDDLVIALADPTRQPSNGLESTKRHAEQRAGLPAYSLEQVIQEYCLLRCVILDVLMPLSSRCLKVILNAVDFGIQQTSTHYVEVQDAALRESEERFRLLVNNVRDYAIFMLDPEGYVSSWNRGAEHIHGYAAEDIIGKHFSVFYTEEDAKNGKPARVLQTASREGHFEEQALRTRRDGSTFIANVILSAIRDQAGRLRGYAKVTRDVTERRALEIELHNRAEALAEANYRKDEFLAMLSHELRNPLASITNSAAIMRLRPNYDPEFGKARDTIERQGKHLVRLVDDLLDVARITRGKIELYRAPVELKQLIEQVADSFRPIIKERQQKFIVSLPDTMVWLQGDAVRLSQVLGNLLQNSTKYTASDGTIELRAWVENDQVIIQVRDTGVGIDPQLLPHIFDMFTQGDASHQASASGLGIGLSLVKQLIEMHDGTVSAHSKGPGKGTEFCIHLPVFKPDEALETAELQTDELQTYQARRADPDPGGICQHPIPKTAPQQPVADNQALPDQVSRRILIVDDDVDAALSVAALLRFFKHAVRVVHSGGEALAAVAEECPEIVLLDIGLPDMEGYEVARRLRAQPAFRNLTLIALSGYGQESDKRRAREAGFDNHLTKPADLDTLQNAVSGLNKKL